MVIQEVRNRGHAQEEVGHALEGVVMLRKRCGHAQEKVWLCTGRGVVISIPRTEDLGRGGCVFSVHCMLNSRGQQSSGSLPLACLRRY